MAQVRLLVADDHELIRQGLRRLLEGQPDWKVVSEASNGREAVETAKELKPDVAILDITMPELNGLEAARQIARDVPGTEVLILTVHATEELVRQVLDAGARGYVLKSDAARDLVTAVGTLLQHKPFFTPRISEMVLQGYLKPETGPQPVPRLSPRERQILQLLAEGKSTKEVAAALGLSVKTAETHRSNIMHKLNMHSVSDLVRYAIRNKVIEA